MIDSKDNRRLKDIYSLQLLSFVVFLLTVAYLALINYQLPFLTMDEIRATSTSFSDSVHLINLYGRPSQVIGTILNKALSFYNVEYLSLTPRFFAMMALLYALSMFFSNIVGSLDRAVLMSCFILVTHQLDWQHNGLIAFFGGYCLTLSLFLFAVRITQKTKHSRWHSALACLMFFFSFASEFFVGLALVYMFALYFDFHKNRIKQITPILLSLLIYTLFYIVLKFNFQINVHAEGMSNYLVGSAGKYSFFDITKGYLIYLVNSMPLYDLGPVKSLLPALLITVTVALMAVIMFRNIYIYKHDILRSDVVAGNNVQGQNSFSVFSIILCMIFVQPILMALQPMKLEWALSGASQRYAFSFYTWIGIAALIFILYFKYVTKNAKVNILIFIGICCFSIVSACKNIEYARGYKESFLKWQEVHKLMNVKDRSSVDLPISLLIHPYIVSPLVPSKKHMDAFFKFNYNKTLKLCIDGYDLSGPQVSIIDVEKYIGLVPGFINSDEPWKISIENFHGGEAAGRWTNGKISKIYLPQRINKGDVIKVEVTNVFGQNAVLPTNFKVGADIFTYVISQPQTISLLISNDSPDATITIYSPALQSPLATGAGSDSRNLGIMIKNVQIFRPNRDGKTLNVSKGCY